jgi:uncharacterized membrane protein
VRGVAIAAALLLIAGVATLALAVVEKTTSFAIVVFLPVFYSTSWELPVGTIFVMLGVLAAFAAVSGGAPDSSTSHEASASSGGLVVIGPLPIFLGSFRDLSPRVRTIVTILCVIAFLAALVAVWFIL